MSDVMTDSKKSNSKLNKIKAALGIKPKEIVPSSNQSSLDKISEALSTEKSNLSPDILPDNLPSTQVGRTKPQIEAPSTYKKETRVMENARKEREQVGHRRLGISVHSRERANDEPLSLEQSIDAEATSSLMQNPLLDNQRFDGIDPNVNPVPAMNTEARTEFDNIKREQELQKQLRLGLSPDNAKQFNAKPTPRGY
jgi:hypothetical protein